MKDKLIGDKIKEARKQAGLTQWQLANKVFVSESYIALIESNRRNPSMNVLAKIAEILHITTDHIVFGTQERDVQSFSLEWERLIEGKTPTEIQTALKMLTTYFDCLDEL